MVKHAREAGERLGNVNVGYDLFSVVTGNNL